MYWTGEVFKGEKGYAVEAGAFDGVFFSETISLEEQGWECLCIEPNPNMWKKLTSNRKLCLPYALGRENKDGVDFEIYSNPVDNSREKYDPASFSSFKIKEELLVAFDNPPIAIETVKVNVRTLDYCLEKANFPRVDFLNLDVEGWELEVLEGFTFEKWNPKLLVIENILEKETYRQYMYAKHYTLVDRTETYGDIYIKGDKG